MGNTKGIQKNREVLGKDKPTRTMDQVKSAACGSHTLAGLGQEPLPWGYREPKPEPEKHLIYANMLGVIEENGSAVLQNKSSPGYAAFKLAN